MSEEDTFPAGKDRWDLMPVRAMRKVVRVLTFGAEKHDDHNWRLVQNWRDRYYAAAMRHLAAWREGETHDPETGEEHLAHAMCYLVFLSEMEADMPRPDPVDTRPPPLEATLAMINHKMKWMERG